jgi:hypothetical protein
LSKIFYSVTGHTDARLLLDSMPEKAQDRWRIEGAVEIELSMSSVCGKSRIWAFPRLLIKHIKLISR